MERIIRLRSLKTDRTEALLKALGKAKEDELSEAGIIHTPLFRNIIVAPSLEEERLGYFSSQSLLIVISEKIALECDSTTVQNIFLHELAHALDYNLHGTLSGHSSQFRTCCRILGVDPDFEKSHVRTTLTVNNEKKDKIRKLLALSSSPFENEASEAIRKAKELMAKSGISLEKDEDERIYMVPLYQAKRFPFSIRKLLGYISSVTGVYVVTSCTEEGKTAVAYGSLEETEASIYLYDYLTNATEREIARLRRSGEHVTKDSFLCGALSSLMKRTSDDASDNAIIVIQGRNRALAKKIVFPDAKLSHRAMYSRGGDWKSYTKGQGFGSSLAIPSSFDRKELE